MNEFLFSSSLAAVSRLVSGAAVDRHDGDRQRHTSVINLLGTTRDRGAEEEHRGVGPATAEYGQEGQEEEDYDEEYYYDDDYEHGMSGEYELELPQGKAAASVGFQKIPSRCLCMLERKGIGM